ncbi:MAG: E3 ubiquitin ligase family protein [Chromatiales bacterium]|nr:E3 ubiquitin ligase family protein [Chromatiales bacterium]
MSITEQMIHLSTGQFWFFFGLAVAASLAGFYFAFRNLRRARIIEDIPTARIRSAQQGYVELHGQARGLPPKLQIAPLSTTPCCWFRYKIEKRHDKGWRTLETQSSGAPFLIDDDTGECVILPEGAAITASDKRVWHGNSRYPTAHHKEKSHKNRSTLQQVSEFLTTDLSEMAGDRYRYTEEYIYPNDRLYVIGLFKSLDEMDHSQSRHALSREILREWKSDQPQLLHRFDQNRDGKIDPAEWEQARREAQQLAAEEYQQQLSGQTLHSISATDSSNHPFLISTLPEFKLVKHYRFWAFLSATLFFISGTSAVMMLAYGVN